MKMTKLLKDILKNDEIMKCYDISSDVSFAEMVENKKIIPNGKGIYIFYDCKLLNVILYCGKTIQKFVERMKKHITFANEPNKFRIESSTTMLKGILKEPNRKQKEYGYSSAMYDYINSKMKRIGVVFISVDRNDELENLEKYFIGKYSYILYFNNKDRHFNVSESRYREEVEKHYKKALSYILKRNQDKMVYDVIDGMEMEGGNKNNNMFEIKDIDTAKKKGFKIIIGKMCTRTHDSKLRRMVVITDEKLRERLANKNIVSIDGVRNKDYAFCDECNVKKLKEFTKANKKRSPAYMNVGIQLDYERKNGSLGLKSLNIS